MGCVNSNLTLPLTKQASNQPTDQPTKQPTNQPTNQPADQPTNQPTNQPTDQPTNQQSNQPTNQQTNQPTNQSTNKATNKATKQPINQQTNQATIQPSNQPTKQPTNQPNKQQTNQQSNQPTNHDAKYWLKWTAGNDVRGTTRGVGRRGWNVVWVGVCCMLHWSISYFPLSPSCTQIWFWVNNDFHHHGTPWTCSVVSVPTWMVFHSRSLSRLSTALAILMDVRAHSSCFAYSEAPDCSFPGA